MYEIWNNDCYLFSPSAKEDPYTILNEERRHYPRAYMIQVTNGVRTLVSSDPVIVAAHGYEEEEDFDYDDYED